jgi:hypothetical protein
VEHGGRGVETALTLQQDGLGSEEFWLVRTQLKGASEQTPNHVWASSHFKFNRLELLESTCHGVVPQVGFFPSVVFTTASP